MDEFTVFCNDLEQKIIKAYNEGVTISEAELIAAEFLHAQMVISERLRHAELDSRMRKSGVKALKAAVYLEGAAKGEKKPSDVMLNAQVDVNELVQKEQERYDVAEVEAESLHRYFSIFKEAHVYFRGIAKGRFE